VSRKQIIDWIPRSIWMEDCARNPFWRLDVSGFIEGGWITGWDRGGPEGADDPGMVTEKFIEVVSNPRIGPRGTVVSVAGL
jgi:hypothetical protein